MTTLIIDTGQDIVGVYSVEQGNYVPYRGPDFALAIQRIVTAGEVVTYNGKLHDLDDLRRKARLPVGEELLLKGTHTDMRSICWSDRILGKCLRDTYLMHFTELSDFPDTHEGSNESDVYMTFKLWELWKQGGLKILDGNIVAPFP